MSIKVMQWVWEHSPSTRGDRLVLLAIADCASDDGTRAWPSLPTIAEKANLSVRACQSALRRLVEAGYLEIEMQAGPKGCNRYTVLMGGVKKVQGEDPAPVKLPTQRGEVSDRGGEVSDTKGVKPTSPVTVLEPSIEPLVKPSAARTSKTFTDDVISLAAFFTESVPISNTYRTRTTIAKALGAGVSPERIRAALTTLIEEGRGCTEDQLRIALQAARGSPRSTTDHRVSAALDLAARFATQEQKAISK
jgi:hypothetical protein